jgi:hypothetical protein
MKASQPRSAPLGVADHQAGPVNPVGYPQVLRLELQFGLQSNLIRTRDHKVHIGMGRSDPSEGFDEQIASLFSWMRDRKSM